MVAAAKETEEHADEIEVLACNWTAIEAFQRCHMQFAVGQAGAACMGITAEEIRAVLVLRGIPKKAWSELLDDLKAMGQVAARTINQRIARTR